MWLTQLLILIGHLDLRGVWWSMHPRMYAGKDMCLKEIGLVFTMLVILDSIINTIGDKGGPLWPSNDHENFHFGSMNNSMPTLGPIITPWQGE